MQDIPEETDKPAEEAAEESVEQTAEQTAEQPADQPVDIPEEQPSGEPVDIPEEPAESAEQPPEQPAEESTEETPEEVPEEHVEEPAEKPAEPEVENQPAEPAVEPTVQPETPAEQVVEHAEVPAEQPAEKPTEAPVAPEAPQPVKKKILLVEDDVALAAVYRSRLELEDFEIYEVNNGEQALQAAKEFRPDLILLDAMMPKISGFDVLDILRHTPDTANIRVIMLTALSQPKDKERAESLGVDDYLVKSQVVIGDVVERVRHHLGMTK